ncbi:MAG: hypothetical protein HY551_01240 [Elusimicrobia bacterium]|nr:hypothetical protein [Elusimicrobiota bacterium]
MAVLRVLCYQIAGTSARGAARATGINHQTCSELLKKFKALGILKPSRSPKHLVLDFKHPLINEGLLPLFELEERLEAEVKPAWRPRPR